MTEGTTRLPIVSPAREARDAGARQCACGASFTCDWSAGKSRCWCQDYPAVMPMNGTEAGCLCPDCLRQAIEARLALPS